MNFRPINDFVLVEPEPVLNRSAAGIVFVEKDEAKPSRGTVIRASEKLTQFTEGSTILYIQGAGEKVKLDGKSYLVLDAEKVVGIVK